MLSPKLLLAMDGDICVISMNSDDRAVAISEWPEKAPQITGALTLAAAAAEDGRRGSDDRLLVEVTGQQLRLHPDWIAGLSDSEATRLGIHPTSTLALDLKPHGRIDQDEFVVHTRWLRPGGQPIRCSLEGCMITSAEGVRRVPEPLWSIYKAAKNLAAPLGKVDRFRTLSEMRKVWPDDARVALQSDQYLSDLRIHYASSVSVAIGRTGPFDFDPVLFGASSLADADANGRAVDEEVDNVLSSSAHRLFVEDRFRREPLARAVYVLRDGEYVFIDESLRPTLDVIRRLQDQPEEKRREFLLNPRRVIRDEVGDEAADRVSLDRIFVDTEQFSARVAGIDVWRKPVLPWLTPSVRNEWIPERFGLRIGEDYFVTPVSSVPELLQRVEAAKARGSSSVEIAGLLEPVSSEGLAPQSLPVTDAVVQAVRALGGLIRPPISGAQSEERKEQVPRDRYFLLVRENFEQVDFAAPDDDKATADDEKVERPAKLRTELKQHQEVGLRWLIKCLRAGRPGALLADDMGLGKTLQAIAFMSWLQERAATGYYERAPFLIVAPTGLLGNWRDEINKHLIAPRLGALCPAFGPDLRSLREEDSFGDRDIELGRSALKAEAWRDAGVVLTTYETLRDYHFSFARSRFALIIFDEIQKLKNPASQLTRAAKTIHGQFILGMTGTPVENRLQDLWSLMDILTPGLLGSSRDFERRHPADNSQALSALRDTLTEDTVAKPPYMLRRLKADCLDGLPDKKIHRIEVDMPALQAATYKEIVLRAATLAGSNAMSTGGMLSTLAAMRGVSLHPIHPRGSTVEHEEYIAASARLIRALQILDDICKRGEKALVFVEDLAMQEKLSDIIHRRYSLRRPPARINGTVAGARRQDIVRNFQGQESGFDVLILSPKAGGVGLTLTEANHVIHLSRWWNPAVEDQATDRVYRMGQTKDVHIYLPMAVHPDPLLRPSSFDIRLDALIDRKRQLTQNLFAPREGPDIDLTELFGQVAGATRLRNGPETVRETGSERSNPRTVEPSRFGENMPRVWRISAGDPRPTEEILALFRGANITHVHIRDPYALARSQSRNAQISLLSSLRAVAKSLGAITVQYAPDAQGDLPETMQRRSFGSAFAQQFSQHTPRLSLVRQPRRTSEEDFHDRFIDIEVRGEDGALSEHSLIIGRGVEALYDLKKQCTVSYVPPSTISRA